MSIIAVKRQVRKLKATVKSMSQRLRKAEAELWNLQHRVCPECHGKRGWREYPDVMTGDTLNCDCSHWHECKTCKGTGYIKRR